MNFSNWLYLGAGIGLGIGICRLFLQPTKSASIPIQNAPQQQENQLLQELKQTQLAYYQSKEMSQFQAGFLARISHELRSPLGSIIGLHQLILTDLCDNPEEEREFVGQAHEKSLKLLKLIDEILNVSKIESGRNKLDIETLQLSEFLQEIYNLTYLLAVNRNYPFTLSPPDPKIYILADSRWLKQVLINLIDTTIAQMEAGNIYLSSHLQPTDNYVNICLDVPTETVVTSESIDLMIAENQTTQKNIVLSPGMKLSLHQSLVELMGGKLEILPFPTNQEEKSQLTRWQISMPLTTPEVESLQEQNQN
ncbi:MULTISPECIES: sensor histidine kinase KdpD [Nostocales]|uniref:sensor histidine kinase n=1 Tax=Nostocales TaxID=1161 RepID=UPI00029B6549|nr:MULTISPECIES: HAMP domain-containing sensor histidine kinase [Nostocales]AFW96991.1 two-component sensor histidine kinase [Anabaena sp. 90]MTJ17142.1 HAMP domain-containing histidine kinase [Dolichospermum sp. UHCC 0299]MTJ21607.1 HAMP domain-containing histidine kinase [Dolichospermum sp. UHCC 0352]MTJ39613.1 HAMP domain-containing histidine kinase [Dolichospermum sp. UHCC 0406]